METAIARVGMPLPYSATIATSAAELRDFERAGLDVVFLAEAYTFDAVSQLGYLAGQTSTVTLAAGILNIYTRTPSLLAMSAAGIDSVSNGRFLLGLGASGPQVIEGFHGVPYEAPLARTREVLDICRQVWRRERVEHEGTYFHVPLTPEHGGSGLGKPLKLINRPVRDRIPTFLAALGPKNVELAAELFEGWAPIFYFPERAEDAFGDALRNGSARRDPSLGPLDVIADTYLAVTEDPAEQAVAHDRVRDHLALYVGGMGAPGQNFYTRLIARFGFESVAAQVQELFLGGHRAEAAAAIPLELIKGVSLIGAESYVAERAATFLSAGVGTINAVPLAATHEQRVRDIETLKRCCS